MNKSFGEFVIQRRWRIIVVSFIVVAITSFGAVFLKTTSDSRVFFSEGDPMLTALDAFENTYTRDENVLIAIEPKNGAIFTRETLAAVEELTEKSWQIPYSRRVDSITNFQHTWANGDDLTVEDLVANAMELSGDQIERIKTIALSEPLLVRRLLSPSGDITGINITTAKPGNDPGENTEVALYVKELAEDFRGRHPDMNVYLSGMIMLDNAFLEATEDDMATLIPIMLAIMVVMTAVLMRSIGGTVATILIIGASAAVAIGAAGWYGIYVTDPTAAAPVIILTLAVADSIHILSTMMYEMHLGKTKHEAIIESLRINLHPVFLTSLTTAIGFLSMNSSNVPPFRELGNIVAVGVTAAFFFSILLLPALMSILPIRAKPKAERSCLFCDYFGDLVVRKRRYFFWGTLAIMLALATGLWRIELNDNFVKYFDESYAVRTDSDYIQKHLTGGDYIEYSLDAGEEGGINRPEYLIKVEEFATWFRQQPKVKHVSSITEIVKRLNRNMHGDDPAYYKIPDSRELAAQYLLLYEMSLPFGLDLNSQINLDRSASRFTVTLKEISTNEQREIEERGNTWLKENGLPGMYSPATGFTLMFAHITKQNIESMLGGTAVALVLISLIMIFALRSVKMGLISLLPNLTPAIMAFGLWGLSVGRINLAVSVVAAMSLGIVVDDTVHFLSTYTSARRKMNMNPTEAVRYSFTTVGMAIITTSVVLAAGFMVLTLSGFGINSAMGLLTAIVIIFALMADFMFLPPLLIAVDRKLFKRSSEFAGWLPIFNKDG